MELFEPTEKSQKFPFILRSCGIVALGILPLLFPGVGEHRFLLAFILIVLVAPFATLLERYYPVAEFGPTQPFLDVCCCITLIHLAPNVWFAAFVTGGLTANSLSVHLCRKAIWVYPLLNLLFLVGMAAAAVIHGVENWLLPVLAYLACLPSLAAYLTWNVLRHLRMTDRSQRLKDVSLIAGGVAHDFNNILTVIVGYAELAMTELPDQHPASESLEVLLTGTQRGKLLTDQLLAFANHEMRSETDVELVAELQELIPLLQTIVNSTPIDLVSAHRQLKIRGDRTQIQQIFMNLILNAAESMAQQPGAVVRVTLDVETDAAGHDLFCIFTVTDTGGGILDSDLKNVFDPFFSSKKKGSGMGLACTRRAVEQHNGTIEITSQLGHGTTVAVRIPILLNTAAAATVAPPSRTSPAGRRILVVDDDSTIRDVLRFHLSQLGYDVTTANNGAQAVDTFLMPREHFDCVLLDLRMPIMDGWTCRRELNRIRPDIPIVLMSGFAPKPPEGEDNAQNEELFLSKPFSQSGLAATLEKALTSVSSSPA